MLFRTAWSKSIFSAAHSAPASTRMLNKRMPLSRSSRAQQQKSDDGKGGSGKDKKPATEEGKIENEISKKEESGIKEEKEIEKKEKPTVEKEPVERKDFNRGIRNLQQALNVIENSLVGPASADNVRRVPALATFHRPLFPGFYKAITISDKNLISLIRRKLSQNQPFIGMFMSKQSDFDKHASGTAAPVFFRSDIHSVGSLCQIYNAISGPNNSITLLLYPHKRIGIKAFVPPGPMKSEKEDIIDDSTSNTPLEQFSRTSFINIEELTEIPPANDLTELVKDVIDELTEISLLNPLVKDQLNEFYRAWNILGEKQVTKRLIANASKLADFAVSMCDGESSVLQDALETLSIEDRLRKSLELLRSELINAELQGTIRSEIDRAMNERDKTEFLQNKLKSIQKEMGLETLAREKIIDKFTDRCKAMNVPPAAKKTIDEEMAKLSGLSPSSQEFNLTSQYLDWLTMIPWGKNSQENLDVLHAAKVLDEDHYGLKDVKERILEFIAVGKMRGSVEGKIICLNGPPGVGKTSVGKSIAKALNRQFYRFSVGGLYDVAEIKGHRRTYVGAMPGKLVQALKKVQTQNPLILIDEVDKLGHGGHSGDPSSALLEVLDPEQNSSFIDHYMDIPIDLSKILFVCTANTIDTIPGPLLDRMEVVNLSGYVAEEKRSIAQNYLIPETLRSTGLKESDVNLAPEALDLLINSYCRESGVRNLKKHIDKIFRKAALHHVTANNHAIVQVSPSNLKDFVGSPLFSDKRMYTESPPAGVVMGLAYNSFGGSSLYIESVLESPLKKDKTSSFTQTGNLGSVMKESSHIAYFFARSLLSKKQPDNDFFDHAAVHLHVPEGATPKDGPSAGISMTTSLLSLATGKAVDSNLAMTGEITLTGRVLKIGGVKEKVMAAKRAEITHLILPQDNRNDFEELDEKVRQGIQVDYVSDYQEVYDLLFQ